MLSVFALSYFFINQSLRLDEAQSLWQTSRGPVAILGLVAEDVHVPLYHELLRLWRVFVGDSVESARLLSQLFFLLSIPALYALGAYAYNRATGLFATLLFAISPFMNWYGSEIRMYTLFTFFAIVNQLFFLRLFRQGGNWTTVGYVLSAVLGVFTHYFFLLVLGTQGVFYLMRRSYFPPGSLKRLCLTWFIVLVAFLPWAYYVYSLGSISNQEPLLPVPTTVNLFSAFSEFLFGFQDDHLNTFMLSLWPITIIFGVLALRQSRRPMPETEYFALATFLPIFLVFVGSLIVQPVFVSRYLIFTIPSLFLLIASILSLYPKYVAIAARTILVGLMLLGLNVEISNPAIPVKEDYRDAASYIDDHIAAQDVLVLSAPFTLYPVEYYYHGTAPVTTLPVWNQYAHGAIPAFNPATLPNEVSEVAGGHQYLWLLLSYDQGYQDQVRLYMDTHYARVISKNFSPGLDLYVYQLRYDTPVAKISSNRFEP